MSAPSIVRCIVSAPSDECLSDLAALCRAVWTSHSHVHDDLVCRAGGGETVGKLADSHLTILPVGSEASHVQMLELVATPEPGRHVAPAGNHPVGRTDATCQGACVLRCLLDLYPGAYRCSI